MRITFLAPPPNLSGGIRVIALHAAWLQARGHEVVIAHPARECPPVEVGVRSAWRHARALLAAPRHQPSHFDGLPVPRVRLPAWRLPRDGDLPDADVVVATWWKTAEWMARLGARKGAKAYFVQGHEVYEPMPPERVRATYRLQARMITVSEWLRAILTQEYGAADVRLAPNGVDLQRFRAAPRARQALPTVGMVYSSAALKGCDVAIEAVRRAREVLPGLRFVVFGAESAPSPDLPLPAFAEYHPRPTQESIPQLYAGCDVWLSPSRSEGFGLPVLEAMACGTPVVATPAGAAAELIAGGGGILVPADDAHAMAQALVGICSGPEGSWAEMATRAARTAQSRTWERGHLLFERALQAAADTRSSADGTGGRLRSPRGIRGRRPGSAAPAACGSASR